MSKSFSPYFLWSFSKLSQKKFSLILFSMFFYEFFFVSSILIVSKILLRLASFNIFTFEVFRYSRQSYGLLLAHNQDSLSLTSLKIKSINICFSVLCTYDSWYISKTAQELMVEIIFSLFSFDFNIFWVSWCILSSFDILSLHDLLHRPPKFKDTCVHLAQYSLFFYHQTYLFLHF